MPEPTPDWILNTPSTPAIHNQPAPPAPTLPFTPAQLEQIGLQFIEGLLSKVVQAIVGVFIPGDNGAAFAQLQAWATDIEALIGNVPAEIAASVAGVAGLIQTAIQQVINTILGGGLGAGGPASILSLLNQGLHDVVSLWAQLFGQQATTQAQLDALTSGGFSYDPALHGVTGWSNLVGTLALSSRGAFIQAATQTVAYRSSGLSVDKYGTNFVIDPTMRGVAGVGICADSAGASWVGLLAYRGFDGDALWLVTAASPTLWVVQKQADLSGVNRLSGLTTLDLRTDGVNKFWAKLNGQPVPALDWTDGTGIATHNPTHRGVILLTNGLNRSEDSYNGPALRGKVVSYAA